MLAELLIDAVRQTLGPMCSPELLEEELREQGLIRARDFSWDRSAAQTLEVYRDVASRRHLHAA
jgi:glycogen synthase